MAFNQSCYGLRANKSIINNVYLYYLLKSTVRELKNNTHGSVFDTITKDTFSGIEADLPPIEEQIKISNILKNIDDKIELNQQINDNLEKQAQAIFKSWFVDFEPFKDEEFVDSELGKIPKGWTIGNLGKSSITYLISSGIDKFNGIKKYLATADVENTIINRNLEKIYFDKRPTRANMQPRFNTVWFAKMKDSRKLIVIDDYS